jgi:ribose transport system substrate-binding protein
MKKQGGPFFMKRRNLSLMITLILAISFVLAGCGKGANSGAANNTAGANNTGATNNTAEANAGNEQAFNVPEGMVDTSEFKKDGPYKIGFSNISIVNTWRVQLVRELEAEAKRKNVTLYTTDAGGDVTKQISDVQDLLTRGIDALMISPGSPTATNAAMKKALKQGVPVIAFNADVEGEDSYTAFVGSNEVEFGYSISKWLLEEMGGKGNIVVLNGIAGNKVSTDRYAGLTKALEELPDGGKNFKILSSYDADWAYDKGKQAMEQALAAYPQIDGVWSQGGAMAQGAMEAIQASGRDMIPVTGEDNNGYLKLWKKLQPSGFTGIAASSPTWQSATALQTALDVLQGKPVKKKDYIPTPVIKDADLDKYLKSDLSDSYWANSKLTEEELNKYYMEK